MIMKIMRFASTRKPTALAMLFGALIALGAAQVPPARSSVIYEGSAVAKNTVLFRLRDSSQITALRQALTDTLDIDSLRPVGGAGAWLLHSRSLSVGFLIAALHDRSDVLYAEPDVL